MIGLYESNVRQPSLNILIKLSAIYKVSYLILSDAYVKRNNTSDDEYDEDSLYDRFIQVFDGIGNFMKIVGILHIKQ